MNFYIVDYDFIRKNISDRVYQCPAHSDVSFDRIRSLSYKLLRENALYLNPRYWRVKIKVSSLGVAVICLHYALYRTERTNLSKNRNFQLLNNIAGYYDR